MVANSGLRLFIRCDIAINELTFATIFCSLRYIVLANSELQLFVRLRYFVKYELTVATILVRRDILWWRTQSCNYLFGCDNFNIEPVVAICNSLRCFVNIELRVATVRFVAIIFQYGADGCDFLVRCDIVSL